MPVDRKYFEMHPVDMNNLERLWVEHSSKFEDFAFGAVEARREHSRAKAKIKVVKAEASAEIRRDPTGWEDYKTSTDKGMEHAVESHPKVIKAINDEIDAKYQLDLWEAGVETMLERKATMESLAFLAGRIKRSEPYAPPEVMEDLSAGKKKATYGRVSNKLTDRKKKNNDD